ncbi:MAG TPA: YkgJ family cysteine cluster protein [Planctomycetota bacterium]|nr:YkgJ family cysteine cluster protein [Planctomycetota bacterium]
MVVTIAPPPARSRARRVQPSLPPRAPSALHKLWPASAVPPDAAAQLARPYRTGRGVPEGQGKCDTCIGLCCRYVAVEVDAPTEPKDFDLLRWFLLHEGLQLFVDGRAWFLQVFVRCKALAPDNRCSIYATRPEICREYEADGCDRDEAEGRIKMDRIFRSVEELEAWRVPWMKRWEARRRKQRRAAALRGARTRKRRARAR